MVGAALALLLALAVLVAAQDAGTCVYVAETGFWVCGEFRAFYERHGGAAFLGPPLTRAYQDAERGLEVQVFERGWLELHPELPVGERVRLGALVDELGYPDTGAGAAWVPLLSAALFQHFPETGHVVAFAFLQAYRAGGGVRTFGLPRSDALVEGGHIVQYLQCARMEWHPERPSGERILLGAIGREYLRRFPVVGEAAAPQPPGLSPDSEGAVPPTGVMRLQAQASVRAVAAQAGHLQHVYVFVSDQEGRPVAGVQVSAMQEGAPETVLRSCSPTDSRGFSTCLLEVPALAPGQRVLVEVVATYRELQARASASYLVWW